MEPIPPPPCPQPPVVALPAGGAATATIPDGEVFTLSFAHNVGDAHPRGYMIQRFADLVYARSGGRLVIEVFAGGSLAAILT